MCAVRSAFESSNSFVRCPRTKIARLVKRSDPESPAEDFLFHDLKSGKWLKIRRESPKTLNF